MNNEDDVALGPVQSGVIAPGPLQVPRYLEP